MFVFSLTRGSWRRIFHQRRHSAHLTACCLCKAGHVGGGLGSGSKLGREVEELSDPSNLRAQPSHGLCPGASASKARRQARGTAASRVLLQDHQTPQTPGRLLAASADRFALTKGGDVCKCLCVGVAPVLMLHGSLALFLRPSPQGCPVPPPLREIRGRLVLLGYKARRRSCLSSAAPGTPAAREF